MFEGNRGLVIMDGFVKIPNTVYELGLTPSQFAVLCNLIRVQSYREFKGEVEDGWFTKSQNELAKECGFKSRKTLTKVLNTMVKNTIVNYTIDKTDVTKFKITIANNTIVKNTIANNTIDTMVKNTIPAMVNFTTLHNNGNKNKEQDNSINPDMTVDTSTSTNNQAHNVEKEKEQYDVNVDTSNYEPTESEFNEMFGSLKEKQDKEIEVTDTNSNKINSSFEISPSYPNWKDDTELVPVFGDNFKSSELEKLLERFSDKNDKTLHPTRKQLLCMTYLEKLSFCRRDFKNIYEKPEGIDGFESNSWTELIGCVLFKLKPIADKYNFKRTGIPDCEVYQDMFKSFFNKNYNHFKICVPEIK